MIIVPATVEDSEAVAATHVEAWQHAYVGLVPAHYLESLSVQERALMWRGVIEERRASVFVCKVSAEVVGFVAFGPDRDEHASAGNAEIYAIYVKPDHWSSGVGRQLFSAALQAVHAAHFKTVSLWVLAGNDRAIRFYSRAGFVPETERSKPVEIGGAVLAEIQYSYALAPNSSLKRTNQSRRD